MKKTLCIILVIISTMSFAFAETNLSEMSYDDLNALYSNLVKEIMSRPEWKEVKVPTGIWIGGKDIPVGSYSISASSNLSHVWIKNTGGRDVIYLYLDAGEVIGKVTIEEGFTIELSKECTFSPVAKLGF